MGREPVERGNKCPGASRWGVKRTYAKIHVYSGQYGKDGCAEYSVDLLKCVRLHSRKISNDYVRTY